MFYPDRLSPKQHVFGSLKNVRDWVSRTDDLNAVRQNLLGSLDNVISWEPQVSSTLSSYLIQFWFDMKAILRSRRHNY